VQQHHGERGQDPHEGGIQIRLGVGFHRADTSLEKNEERAPTGGPFLFYPKKGGSARGRNAGRSGTASKWRGPAMAVGRGALPKPASILSSQKPLFLFFSSASGTIYKLFKKCSQNSN
jgi:hypothetical protein